MRDDLNALRVSLSLSEQGLADLMGVPIHTLKKWLAGQREPSASAIRLVDVLITLSVVAPDILSSLASEDSKDAHP